MILHLIIIALIVYAAFRIFKRLIKAIVIGFILYLVVIFLFENFSISTKNNQIKIKYNSEIENNIKRNLNKVNNSVKIEKDK